jgi:hypothetical protein
MSGLERIQNFSSKQKYLSQKKGAILKSLPFY